jgi:hypothetical protein
MNQRKRIKSPAMKEERKRRMMLRPALGSRERAREKTREESP